MFASEIIKTAYLQEIGRPGEKTASDLSHISIDIPESDTLFGVFQQSYLNTLTEGANGSDEKIASACEELIYDHLSAVLEADGQGDLVKTAEAIATLASKHDDPNKIITQEVEKLATSGKANQSDSDFTRPYGAGKKSLFDNAVTITREGHPPRQVGMFDKNRGYRGLTAKNMNRTLGGAVPYKNVLRTLENDIHKSETAKEVNKIYDRSAVPKILDRITSSSGKEQAMTAGGAGIGALGGLAMGRSAKSKALLALMGMLGGGAAGAGMSQVDDPVGKGHQAMGDVGSALKKKLGIA